MKLITKKEYEEFLKLQSQIDQLKHQNSSLEKTNQNYTKWVMEILKTFGRETSERKLYIPFFIELQNQTFFYGDVEVERRFIEKVCIPEIIIQRYITEPIFSSSISEEEE